MIEVEILIALALIGILLVLVRISLTLKEMLEAVTNEPRLALPSVKSASHSAADSSSGKPQAPGTEPAPIDTNSAPDTLQDIAAVVAVAHRAMQQGSSNISQ
jgi:type II secretory pathway pseudopilin PulG